MEEVIIFTAIKYLPTARIIISSNITIFITIFISVLNIFALVPNYSKILFVYDI